MKTSLPSLNALYAFNAAARCQSFSQAARMLHITQGAVNRQIKLLEQQLAVRLFVKQGRGVRLTGAGQQLQALTGAVFEQLHQGYDRLQHALKEAPFVLGCSSSLLARWFIPRLERINRALPELRLQVCVTEEFSSQAYDSRIDAVLWFTEPPWPAHGQFVTLAEEFIGPVLSPLHPHYNQLRQQPPQNLLHEPLLQTRSRPQAWSDWAKAEGLDPPQHFGQSFEHLYYLLEAALAGLGVAIAPAVLVEDDLKNGRLCAPWGFVQTQAHMALWFPQAETALKAQPLIQWLKDELNRSKLQTNALPTKPAHGQKLPRVGGLYKALSTTFDENAARPESLGPTPKRDA